MWNIDIISYNYSRALENLLAFSGRKLHLPEHRSSKRATMATQLSNIKHIHGFTDKDMVLGVNDASQILNESFRLDSYFLDAIVKPECNKSIEHLIDQDCKRIINESNLIFGH